MNSDKFYIAHKTRIHLNNKQSWWMMQNCNASRVAYNYAVRFMNDAYFFPNPMDIRKVFFRERYDLYPWMLDDKLILAGINEAIVVDFASAIKHWKKSGYKNRPKFKSRHKPKTFTVSYTTISNKNIEGAKLKLPNIKQWVRMSEPLRYDGKIKKTTFSYKSGKWYVSFIIEVDTPPVRQHAKTGMVGIDWGINRTLSLSNGEFIDMPMEKLNKLEKKIKRLQKQLSVKGFGKNRQKTKAKLSRLMDKKANLRKDFYEKTTKQISQQYATVYIEDLSIKNMTKSAKGTVDEPGKNVKAKSGLNREILNRSPYLFKTLLSRKARNTILVNPQYTSQMCNCCGHVDKDNRNGTKFECIKCGHADHADTNAAKNILLKGVELIL